MTCTWTDRLSQYLDGELDGAERLALEAHLERCPECTDTVAELRKVIDWSGRFVPSPPVTDGWPALEAAIERVKMVPLRPAQQVPARIERRWALRQMIAAGLVMAGVGAGATWLVLRQPAVPPAVVAVGDSTPANGGARAPEEPRFVHLSRAVEKDYDAAVTDLQQILDQGRGRLDPKTLQIVEQSLRTIDQAIAEARAAIQRDSANGYLNEQIAKNMRRKLQLLRATARAITAQS